MIRKLKRYLNLKFFTPSVILFIRLFLFHNIFCPHQALFVDVT